MVGHVFAAIARHNHSMAMWIVQPINTTGGHDHGRRAAGDIVAAHEGACAVCADGLEDVFAWCVPQKESETMSSAAK